MLPAWQGVISAPSDAPAAPAGARVQMEVDGERHVPGEAQVALGGGERVQPVEPLPGGVERQRARVDEAEAFDVAIVGGLDAMPPSVSCTSQATWSGWRIGARRPALQAGVAHQLAEDCSSRQSVLWLAVARAAARLLRPSAGPGAPPLTSSSSLPALSSNDRQPAQAAPASSSVGGAPASTRTTVAPRCRRT